MADNSDSDDDEHGFGDKRRTAKVGGIHHNRATLRRETEEINAQSKYATSQ